MKRFIVLSALASLCLSASAMAQTRYSDSFRRGHSTKPAPKVMPKFRYHKPQVRYRTKVRPYGYAPRMIRAKESRRFRKRRSVAALRARWNRGFLYRPAVKAELGLHAHRIAKLNRMLRLAYTRGLFVRINAAIARENRRHRAKMRYFRVGRRYY